MSRPKRGSSSGPVNDGGSGSVDGSDTVGDGAATGPLRWGAATHQGQVRNENEDAHLAAPRLFVVADGMGGHQAGEVASAMAVQTLRDRLANGASSVDLVIASVVEANASIFHAAHHNAGQAGMGTTLTAIALMPGAGGDATTLALVNVGDSRTYRMRKGVLERVTIDHSYVQELVSTGHITEAEARTHPRRNIVTRALGIEPTVRVDAWTLSMVRGDRFVLCSDGLVDEVPDHEIELVVAAVSDPQAVADELVAMANRHGGRDNVTVLVVDVLQGMDLPPEDAVEVTGTTQRPLQAGRGDTTQQPTISGPVTAGTPTPTGAGVDPATAPTVPTPVLPPRSTGTAGAAGVATAVLPTVPQPAGVPPAGPRKRRITGGMFLFFLAAALLLTATITFVAIALRSDDESPSDTTDTVAVTTTVATDDTSPTTTDATTTTRPRVTTTTAEAATTTSIAGP